MEHKRSIRVDLGKARKLFSEHDNSFAGYFPGGSVSCPDCRCNHNGFVTLFFKTYLEDEDIEKYINSMLKDGAYIIQIVSMR